MPKARRLGNYLKAADLAGPGGTHIVRIETPGEHRETELRQDLALELSVTPQDPPIWKTGGSDPKDWTLNRTSEGTIRDFLGEDTEGWVNQLTRVDAVRMNVMGNMKDVLFSAALTPGEQSMDRVSPPVKPKTTPTAKAPAASETPIYTEAETIWLRYNELSIGKILDPSDWMAMPKGVKASLQEKGILYDKDGYPHLDDNARKALE